jgi:hypothetical protein
VHGDAAHAKRSTSAEQPDDGRLDSAKAQGIDRGWKSEAEKWSGKAGTRRVVIESDEVPNAEHRWDHTQESSKIVP